MNSYRKLIYDVYADVHMSSLSDFSDHTYDYYCRLFEKNYQKYLPLNKDASILELGCGSGYFLEFLKRKGFNNSKGVDISPQMIAIAKKRGLNAVQADIFDFMNKDTMSYDFVIARHLLEHLYKDEIITILKLIYNSLKPGGILAIETPNAGSPLGCYIRYLDFTHEISFTPVSLKQVTMACGFKECKIYPFKDLNIIRRFIFNLLNSIIKPLSKGQLIFEWIMIGIAKK